MPETEKNKRWCLYVDAGQDPAVHGGFVPSRVVENEAGHSPLLGNGPHAAPWIFGGDYKSAAKMADDYNRDKLGLTREQVDDIVISSMTAR